MRFADREADLLSRHTLGSGGLDNWSTRSNLTVAHLAVSMRVLTPIFFEAAVVMMVMLGEQKERVRVRCFRPAVTGRWEIQESADDRRNEQKSAGRPGKIAGSVPGLPCKQGRHPTCFIEGGTLVWAHLDGNLDVAGLLERQREIEMIADIQVAMQAD
jgi:hypothetical protein